MAIQIEYGQLYIGSVFKNYESLLPSDPMPPDKTEYFILPLKRINKFYVLVYDLKHNQQAEYSVSHFRKNFVLAPSSSG